MRTLFRLVVAATLGLVCCPPAAARPPAVEALYAQAAKFGGYEATYGKDPDVFRLQFRSPGPRDADLATLRPLLLASTMPVGLNLNGCESITDAGLAHLKDIPTLRRVSLDSKKVTDAGLAHLAGLTNLEEVYLANDAYTDAGLAHLSKLTKLRKLSVYSKAVTPAGYAHLAGLVNLEEIHVGGISSELGDEALGHMKGMTKLKELSVGRDKLTDAGMGHLKNFAGLQKLRIDGPNVTAAGVAHLAPVKGLQTLTVLSGPGFTGDALAALKDMAALRELELIYTASLDKAGGAHIGKLTGLKKLRLGHVAEGGLAGLAGLTGLETLDLNYSQVGDADLKAVAGLAGLKTLDVQHTRVTDAGLQHLAGLANLRTLYASGNPITDAGLAHVAAVPNLETLSASECKITGTGFKDLAKLTKLKTLWLNGNPVTDANVPALKDVRGLKEVDLTGTKVTDAAAIALKQARPDVRVRDVAGDNVVLDKKPAATRPKAAVEDVSKVEPAFKLTADEFYKECKADGRAAAEKYKGKVVELSGVVDGVGRGLGGDAHVSLKVEKELIGVMCVTADPQPWAKVVKGQKVKLKGKWPEFSISPALVACAFVETGTYAGIRMTAADLAKEYAADPEKTVEKYKDKHLVLTGEVTAKDFNSAGAAAVVLKSGNKVKVECRFTAFDKDLTKPIQVGQTITVVGEFTLNFAGGDEVGLYFCLPLTGP